METLKINHLAPYLPYGLKFATLNDDTEKYYINEERHILECGGLNGVANICMAKYSRPIYRIVLRPLSDLNKDEFSYLAKVIFETNLLNRDWDDTRYLVETLRIRYLPKYILEKLYENHFDLEDLIGLDLAIDINTI